MSEENHQGPAYLLALKQSFQADAASAQARQAERDAAGEQYQGSNKRQAPRYKCEGSVEIREEGCDVRTWATFADMSLHGCYIEAQATYPAGTVLNMKLETNGIRVETRGNVRVSYPYLGMGIAFVGMTGENVARLRQILATACRGCAVMRTDIASTVAGSEAMSSMPVIADPAAVIRELMEFFESREILRREDFVRILRKSQRG